jgi:hypothetical protein
MPDGQDGVPPKHARPGVTHDLLHRRALLRSIAVDRAFRASRFPALETAAPQADPGIFVNFLAGLAQIRPPAMVVLAVNPHHGRDGLAFPFQSPILKFHIRQHIPNPLSRLDPSHVLERIGLFP